MKKAFVRKDMNYPIEQVWELVTDNRNFAWRKDIHHIDILSDVDFVEIYPKGNATHFHIIEKKTYDCYHFQMENKLFKGEFVGKFHPTMDGCRIEFQESIHVKNPIMRIVASFAFNIQKMQESYVEAIITELEKQKSCDIYA